MIRVAFAQLDPIVGSFEANVKKITEAYKRACDEQARLLITPELGICGYPPHDLIERPEMFEKTEKALQELSQLTQGQKCALAVGHIDKNPDSLGRPAQNVVSVFEDGKKVFRQAKTLLPTYDVFDEARYFEPAKVIQLWNCDGRRVAFGICEDLWGKNPYYGRKLYGKDPVDRYQELGAELILSLSSSPYEMNKRVRREGLHQEIARDLKVPLVYVNQVSGNDEILFDGGSFAFDQEGKLIGRLPFFETSFGIVDFFKDQQPPQIVAPDLKDREDNPPEEIEVVTRGLVRGIQDYFSRTGFKLALIGLSGGIDSAVVAALAVLALGKKNVFGVAMPSQHSSGHSLEDAEALARNLGIPFEVRPIKFLNSTAARELSERRGELAPLALENLQSRLRGVILMTLSNHYSALVLTTGNKSELAMGYCTLYGDMAGALGPIGDLYKTQVYQLANHINQTRGGLIPQRSIEKAPSAELKPNQTDQDTLPPYELLDQLLADYIEKGVSVLELEKKYSELSKTGKGNVREILKRLEINEYKRRQAAPVLKVSHKAFGLGRRIPIAKTWN